MTTTTASCVSNICTQHPDRLLAVLDATSHIAYINIEGAAWAPDLALCAGALIDEHLSNAIRWGSDFVVPSQGLEHIQAAVGLIQSTLMATIRAHNPGLVPHLRELDIAYLITARGDGPLYDVVHNLHEQSKLYLSGISDHPDVPARAPDTEPPRWFPLTSPAALILPTPAAPRAHVTPDLCPYSPENRDHPTNPTLLPEYIHPHSAHAGDLRNLAAELDSADALQAIFLTPPATCVDHALEAYDARHLLEAHFYRLIARMPAPCAPTPSIPALSAQECFAALAQRSAQARTAWLHWSDHAPLNTVLNARAGQGPGAHLYRIFRDTCSWAIQAARALQIDTSLPPTTTI